MRTVIRSDTDPAIVLARGVRVAETADGATLVNRRGQVFQLNHTGAFILSALLDSGLPHTIDALARRYGVGSERARDDVTVLTGRLFEHGLLRTR